jgi:hypothetical protein
MSTSPKSSRTRHQRSKQSDNPQLKSDGASGVVMVIAILPVRWDQVDALKTLLGFDEFLYLTLFFWLAVAGSGTVSFDHVLRRTFAIAGRKAADT